MYKLKQLKSGLTIITVPIDGIKTATALVLFGVGSKKELQKNRGVSHFLEHMMFKGTGKRKTARAVAETLDKIGGEQNAFTGKEYTGYYAKVGSDYLDLALEWLSDILLNSTFESKALERERGVIIEEMNMYKDTPMSYVGEVFEDILYGDQPAGWDIIGTKKTIKEMSREDLIKYKNTNYSQKNCVICVSGHFSGDIEKKIEKYFKYLPKKKLSESTLTKERQDKPQFKLVPKKTDQSHCVVGVRAFDMFSPKRFTFDLLASILGGGMSSRLFTEVREKRGLAYYVNCDTQLYVDSGYLSVQAGLDNSKLEEALKIILKEFKNISRKEVTAKELKKAKEYIKGHTLISMESSNSQAMYYAFQQIFKKKILTVEERFKIIDKITAQDIKQVAQEIFRPEKLNLAVIGPQKKSINQIENILNNWR